MVVELETHRTFANACGRVAIIHLANHEWVNSKKNPLAPFRDLITFTTCTSRDCGNPRRGALIGARRSHRDSPRVIAASTQGPIGTTHGRVYLVPWPSLKLNGWSLRVSRIPWRPVPEERLL